MFAQPVAHRPGRAPSRDDLGAPRPVSPRTAASVPLVGGLAPCGFPSPADDFLDRPLDFNDLLVRHPAATFAVRIQGDSMVGLGFHPGDVAVVDRALEPVPGRVVMALVDGGFTIKTLRRTASGVSLEAANPRHPTIHVGPDEPFEVWGVVTHVIRVL